MATSTYKRYGEDTGLNRSQQIDNINLGLEKIKTMADQSAKKDAAWEKLRTGSSSSTSVNRTVGLLDQSKQDEILSEKTVKQAKLDAASYAAQMRQARIDAINTAFAPRIDRQTEQNAAEMSKVRAMNFKKGTIGSGVDTTSEGEQRGLNENALQAIENEKAIKIDEAFGWADELEVAKAKEYTEEKQGEASRNAQRYQKIYDAATNALKAFGQAEATIDDLKQLEPTIYKNLREVGGLSDFEIVGMLTQNNPKMNAELKFENGVVYQYYTDPKTGKVVVTSQRAEGVPDNYKPQFAPDGTLLFLPENFDPTKPIESQVISGGNYRKASSEEEKPFISLSNEDKATLLGAGLSQDRIKYLLQGINDYGLDEVITKEGLNKKQADTVRNIFGGSTTSKLTRQSVAQLFNISESKKYKDAKSFKYVNGRDKLDGIMKTIDSYKAVGYSDEDIIKLLQDGSK